MKNLIKMALIVFAMTAGVIFETHADDVSDGEIVNGPDNQNGKKQKRMRKGRAERRGNEDSERPRRAPRLGRPEQERGGAEREGARNGCPDGTVQIAMAPDNMSFSVIFDKFLAETKASANQRMARVACHVRVPFEVPDNQRITITNLDYRGFVAIPQGSVAALRAGYAFDWKPKGRGRNSREDRGSEDRDSEDRGSEDRDRDNRRDEGRNQRDNRDFFALGKRGLMVNFIYKVLGGASGVSEPFTLSSQEMTNDQLAMSQCGGVTNLRLNTMVLVKSSKPTDALITLDSIDGEIGTGKTALTYFMRYDTCASDQ
jgi:hypothetical protein